MEPKNSSQSERVEKPQGPQKRSKYESPEQNFSAWTSSLQSEKNRVGQFLAFLEERLFFKITFLVLCYCLILSYVIFLPIQYPVQFRIGEMVNHDLISPYSFEMTDEVTTEDKRIKAENAVMTVFDYDAQVFQSAVLNIYKSFKNARQLMRDEKKLSPQTVARIKTQFQNDFSFVITDLTLEWLVDQKFHHRVESALIRVLEKWYDQKIAESPDRVIPPGHSQVLARVMQKTGSAGKELPIHRGEILDLQNLESFQLVDRKTSEIFNEIDRNQIVILAHSMLLPNLTFNKSETSTRRQASREAILPVTIAIKKNQVLVPQGQVIQPFHKAVLRQIESMQTDRRKSLMSIALALVLALSIWVLYSYVERFTVNKVKVAFKDLVVMMLITMGMVFLTKFYLFVADVAFVSRFGHILTHTVFLALAPVAAAPMIIGLLITYGEIVWLYTIFFAFCLGVMEDFNFAFMLATFIGGIAAARGVYSCKTRNDIYRAGIRTGIINALILGFLLFINKINQNESLLEVWLVIPAGFLGGIFSSFITLMIIPFLESVFNYTTDVKLLELSNLNHPLLKQMIVKAPGTYHHSMMVGNMVEAAAEEIGANPLLAKVMSYYHDIGKMEYANYFIENQKPGQNPHDDISPYMSRTLLIAHVKDGAELGIKYKLGQPILDAILQHHGTTVISYFYNKALDQRQNDSQEVSEDEFRYPGPKPQFKESALCMLADSIEAAARTLDEPTPHRLQSIVKTVIQRKYNDGQLDECNLSLKDLTRVENAFVRILLGVYHQRIAYPKSATR